MFVNPVASARRRSAWSSTAWSRSAFDFELPVRIARVTPPPGEQSGNIGSLPDHVESRGLQDSPKWRAGASIARVHDPGEEIRR
jgi:hypothetical protein